MDPQALVGWADCPSPCHHYDHGYLTGVLGGVRALTGIGGASGEEHQFEFTGAGTVLLQSSEALMPEQPTGTAPDEPGYPVPRRRPGTVARWVAHRAFPGSSEISSTASGCER